MATPSVIIFAVYCGKSRLIFAERTVKISIRAKLSQYFLANLKINFSIIPFVFIVYRF